MNREDMVEAGAQAIPKNLDAFNDPEYFHDAARAVLDAVLPEITTVEQVEALPDGVLIMAWADGYYPTFLVWSAGRLVDWDQDGEGPIPPDALPKRFPNAWVVWRP
jgi:hypothetical protein